MVAGERKVGRCRCRRMKLQIPRALVCLLPTLASAILLKCPTKSHSRRPRKPSRLAAPGLIPPRRTEQRPFWRHARNHTDLGHIGGTGLPNHVAVGVEHVGRNAVDEERRLADVKAARRSCLHCGRCVSDHPGVRARAAEVSALNCCNFPLAERRPRDFPTAFGLRSPPRSPAEKPICPMDRPCRFRERLLLQYKRIAFIARHPPLISLC